MLTISQIYIKKNSNSLQNSNCPFLLSRGTHWPLASRAVPPFTAWNPSGVIRTLCYPMWPAHQASVSRISGWRAWVGLPISFSRYMKWKSGLGVTGRHVWPQQPDCSAGLSLCRIFSKDFLNGILFFLKEVNSI